MTDSFFSQFLESCHHFGQTLEKLGIGHERVVLCPDFDLSSSRNKLLKLSTITVTGNIENCIQAFFKQILSLGDSITTIKLNTFSEKSSKSLLLILRELSKLQKPELKIELQRKFLDSCYYHKVVKDFENAMKIFQEEYEDDPIFLKLMAGFADAEPLVRFLEIYGEKFEF